MKTRIAPHFVLAVLALFLGMLLRPVQAQAQDNKKKYKAEMKAAKESLEYEEYANAIKHLDYLLDVDKDNAAFNFWMGKCLYSTYEKQKSLSYFETANRVNPNIDDEFHRYYAYALHYAERYDEAVEQYRMDQERFSPEHEEYKFLNNRISQCLYAKRATPVPGYDRVQIQNMGKSINTEYAEHSPVISADNQTLIFTARRPDSRGADPASGFYDEDIYVSKQSGGGWTQAQNIGLPVNSKGHDATISLTADGKTLYLYRHKRDGGLYRTDFDPATKLWKEPSTIAKPLNSKYYEASVCQSADSSLIFFTSARPGGYGGLDLWMSVRDGKSGWTEPRNLGPKINTPSNEDAPYFHPDGRTLYYSSEGPNGYGGYDIFVTEYDSASGDFLDPINMGAPINTADNEIYFVLSADGLHGYYTSGKEGGFGEKDIYEITFPHPNYPRRRYAMDIVGAVQDAQTLDTLYGTVWLTDGAGRHLDSAVTAPSKGKYTFQLEPSRAYSLTVSVDGYNTGLEAVSTPELAEQDVHLEKSVLLDRPTVTIVETPPVPVKVIPPTLEHLYFDFDKDLLRQQSKVELDVAYDYLQQNPDLRLEIVGHTDWYNDYQYNFDLSMRRANAASNYLLNKGVSKKQLVIKWESETKPIDSNEDDRGRQFNRRCEMRFLQPGGGVAFASEKVKPGSEGPEVDHTTPKGQPGFDYACLDGQQKLETDEQVSQLYASVSDEAILSDLAAALTPAPEEQIDLQHLYFGFDRADLEANASTELDEVAALLQAHPTYTVVLKGHTDASGDLAYNQRLSERRCAAAEASLTAAGIDGARIQSQGFSKLSPIQVTDQQLGRKLSRRVEIEVRDGDRLVATSRQ